MVHLATPPRDSTEDRTQRINLKFLERLVNSEEIPTTYMRNRRQIEEDSSNFFWKTSSPTAFPSHLFGSPSTSSNPMAETNTSGNQNVPPPQNPRIFGRKAKPSPLDFSLIQGAPHDMPKKYFEKVPKFDGVSSISIEDHIDKV